MQSRISLALANKLLNLFESDDRFLTFPLGVGFSDEALAFMEAPEVSGLSAKEQLSLAADFARQLNVIPDDSPIHPVDLGQLLWSEMKRVLVEAKYASSGLTAAEESQFEEAMDFLTDEETTGEGLKMRVHSASVLAYMAYETTYRAAETTYLEEKLTVESTIGVEGQHLQEQWIAYREKELREARERAMQDWITLGYKFEVEAKRAILSQLGPRKYLQGQGEVYRKDIELSEANDLNGAGSTFCTTFFSPRDVFAKSSQWTDIHITRAEIETLAHSASGSLRALFGSGQPLDNDFVSIKIEFNNVQIVRPWFHPEFLASRCWKLANGDVVSDGALPRRGTIPSFIVGILVARSMVVSRRASGTKRQLELPYLNPALLDALRFQHHSLRSEKAAPSDSHANPRRNLENVRWPHNRREYIERLYRGTTIPSPRKKWEELPREPGESLPDVPWPEPPPHPPHPGRPPKRPQPEADEIVTESHVFPGVVVLAFICARVPKAPDPDINLDWSE